MSRQDNSLAPRTLVTLAIDMRTSSSRAVASFSKIENQTLVLMEAVSVSVHGKGNLGDEPRADVLQAVASRSA